ncbi:MAG: D-glycero-beta-D-manno-heptose 1-phosphate adenylyltransferase [Candidatus Omnitrophica bacterium]|nr:D-glycero-beta-D-manno-heptose 1-phosphate adenylyltransferase [Candidatus Omnitrophota bacterium]
MPFRKSLKTSSSVLNLKRKIIRRSQIQELVRRLRNTRKRIVFTNGTFDFIHLGHIRYLAQAKSFGDVLIVGVNTNASVRSYKGPNRPINPEGDRIQVLSALECVDFAVLFSEPSPLKLILEIRPHVLVKGSDWKKNQIAGAREVESWGGKVKRIKLVPGRSTTKLIEGIKAKPTLEKIPNA